MNKITIAVLGLAACALVGVAGAALLAFGRPPQPLPLGTKQDAYEETFTVTAVRRVDRLGPLRAGGQYYIVDVLVEAPFGERPTWNDRNVHVETFAGSGSTRPPARFEIDAPAQRYMDGITGRPGSVHEIRGASSHERLVFDLPPEVEQPGLIFDEANDPSNFFDLIFGRLWQPHRFNLRYD